MKVVMNFFKCDGRYTVPQLAILARAVVTDVYLLVNCYSAKTAG
jgi:hypothetical protein